MWLDHAGFRSRCDKIVTRILLFAHGWSQTQRLRYLFFQEIMQFLREDRQLAFNSHKVFADYPECSPGDKGW